MLGAIALVIFTGPMLAAPALQTSAEARQILPRTLVPSHYDLSLMANPEALTFKGDVQITSTSPTGGRQIVMNAKVAVLHQEIPDAVLRLLPIRSCSIRRFDAQRRATTLRAWLEGRA